MQVENSLLLEVEAYVTNYISEQVPKEYAYHDIQHTAGVVKDSLEIANLFEISEHDKEILQLAAWFHDTGYDKGAKDHELRSARYAREYLQNQDFSKEDLDTIEACIMATKMPQRPQTLLERIICDADLAHIGQSIYWERCSSVRQEMALTQGTILTDQEWIEFEMDFMNKHQFHTPVARQLYDRKKKKHIRQLYKQKVRLNPHEIFTVDGISNIEKKTKKKKKKKGKKRNNSNREIKEINLGRGVETMYRTTYRTHVNLSSIADNKANIMLSINAIVISITLSVLTPRFADNPKLIFPTMVLLAVCLLAVIFATLSTRPKITEGKFTVEDIKAKKSNLLFFGNFYNMKMDDFHWGMMEMIKDPDFLYSSMTRDLYYLGVVLAKKYRYLRICYGIFMYGLIIAVLSFAVAFMLPST